MNKKTKELVRAFIVEKIRETTCLELNDFAHKHGIYDYFSFAECFDNESYRVEKFFCFPDLPETPKKMTKLSPQAQLILSSLGAPEPDSPLRLVARGFAIETLRAAAQAMPIQELTREPPDAFEQGLSQGQALAREELLAWADELEAGR